MDHPYPDHTVLVHYFNHKPIITQFAEQCIDPSQPVKRNAVVNGNGRRNAGPAITGTAGGHSGNLHYFNIRLSPQA